MLAVKGLYDGNKVHFDRSSVPLQEECEVIITFLSSETNAAQHSSEEEKKNELAKRQAGFEHFMKYKGCLPADFDYKKDLEEYRDERYGYTH
jgi:hypothetical protein